MEEKLSVKYLSWGQISRLIIAGKKGDRELLKIIKYHTETNTPYEKGFIKGILTAELQRVIKQNPGKEIILDGYPRRIQEAEEMLDIIKQLDLCLHAVVNFNIMYDTLLNRVLEREYCEKCGKFYSQACSPKIKGFCDADGRRLIRRIDDTPELIESRYSSYLEEALPAFEKIAPYADVSFHVNANRDEILIFSEIISSLEHKEKINYRLCQKTGVTKLPTTFGTFELMGFQNIVNYQHHLVLSLGNLSGKRKVPVRIHSSCITGDVFFSKKCDCGQQLHSAMEYIQKRGYGAIIYLFQEGRGINILNKINAYALQDSGLDTMEANEALNLPPEMRQYDEARDVVSALGICSVDLISNSPDKIKKLHSLGIVVENVIQLPVSANPYNEKYLMTKRSKSNHNLDLKSDKKERGSVIEKEIKFIFPLKDKQMIRELIDALSSFVFIGQKFEKTSILDNVSGDMKARDARLRIREISDTPQGENKMIQFSYKRRLQAEHGIKKEEEIEAEMTADSPKNLFGILREAGYLLVEGYERYRETYISGRIKLTLDTFPFALILEIEGEDGGIHETCKMLGLAESDSYPKSCDDVYAELCARKGKAVKSFISFDDSDMPSY